jgi:hypothetical protein
LDQYFLLTSSNELSLNQKKSNDKREGYDERYSIYNSSLTLNNPNVSYKIKLEEYKSLLRIKLFFLKQRFLSYLESPTVSTLTKTTLIEKYHKKNDLFHQKLKNGGLFKDYEDFEL